PTRGSRCAPRSTVPTLACGSAPRLTVPTRGSRCAPRSSVPTLSLWLYSTVNRPDAVVSLLQHEDLGGVALGMELDVAAGAVPFVGGIGKLLVHQVGRLGRDAQRLERHVHDARARALGIEIDGDEDMVVAPRLAV